MIKIILKIYKLKYIKLNFQDLYIVKKKCITTMHNNLEIRNF